MKTKEIREKFLEYFKKNGHAVVPSCKIVPDNDPTTLFTSAGMQQMIPYLLGKKHSLGDRIANSQKCLRTQDIEEVGDNRHMTFFEMLGNWSFNDYFKKEQLAFVFDFLVNEIHLDPHRLYVTVFKGAPESGVSKDDETEEIWKKLFKNTGVDHENRIFYYPAAKNWWSRSGIPEAMPEGELGGPDSEIFWDFGAKLQLHEKSSWADQPCHINCDCGRYLEIGNNVFMEYIKHEDQIQKIASHNVDFGGGLERIAMASIDSPDAFKIDLFEPLIAKIEELSGKKYGASQEITAAMRVIADHIRSAVFLVADGVIPSNKAQGYFARRLIRRAVVKSCHLGVDHNFLAQMTQRVCRMYDGIYSLPVETIITELDKEETKFRETLNEGLKEMERLVACGNGHLSGKQLFNLHQSFGFPLELSIEIAEGKNITIGENAIGEFKEELKKHQELSRTASVGMFKGGLANFGAQTTKLHTAAHLMLAALRRVLGDHVVQKGSNITAERLRFDFSHPQKMTSEEIKQVEDLVNEQIEKKILVKREEMDLDKARKCGAAGGFGDKYGSRVSVYIIGDFSKEICGGPHVGNTSEIGSFKILKEESSSSGVRRIKAVLNK